MVPYNKFKLSNDLQYILIPNQNINTISICIYVKVGSRDEVGEDEGLSHLLEHMMFKGTKKRPSSKIISKELDGLGGSFNAYTDKNVTCYHIKVSYKYVKEAIDIFSDMLFNSLLRKKDIDDEKPVVVEEIKKIQDEPASYVIDLATEVSFQEHPLSHCISGTISQVVNYKPANIRKYYQKYYVPSNMVVSICGKFKTQQMHQLMKKFFTPKKPYFQNHRVNQELKLYHHPKVKISQKTLAQTHLVMTFPTVNMFDSKRFSLDLVSTILAGNMSSRLFLNLREEAGLAYNIVADTALYQDCGMFMIVTSIDEKSLFQNITKGVGPGALPIIIDEIKKLQTKGITQSEFKNAKRYLLGQLVIGREDTISMAEFYGKQLVFQYPNIMTIDDVEAAYQKITITELNQVVKELFDFANMNLAIIGDYKISEVIDFISKKYLHMDNTNNTTNTTKTNNTTNTTKTNYINIFKAEKPFWM